MKPLEIDFKANTIRCDYSWKMNCKCKSVEHLRAMKTAIDAYLDMKIAEAKVDEGD